MHAYTRSPRGNTTNLSVTKSLCYANIMLYQVNTQIPNILLLNKINWGREKSVRTIEMESGCLTQQLLLLLCTLGTETLGENIGRKKPSLLKGLQKQRYRQAHSSPENDPSLPCVHDLHEAQNTYRLGIMCFWILRNITATSRPVN